LWLKLSYSTVQRVSFIELYSLISFCFIIIQTYCTIIVYSTPEVLQHYTVSFVFVRA
jgi:hypothetical protein